MRRVLRDNAARRALGHLLKQDLDMHHRPSLPGWLCTKSLELAAGRRARPSLTHRNPAAESRIVQPR